MGRSLYHLPTTFLVEQAMQTRDELEAAAEGPGRSAWARAGVDVEVHARAVDQAFRRLWAAQTRSVLAGAHLRVAWRLNRIVVEAAAAWMGWLDGVLAHAERLGVRGMVLSPRRNARSTPSLPWVTERMRSIVTDLARERARLVGPAGDASLLDRGAVHLAALEAASLATRDAAEAKRLATVEEQAARAVLRETLQELDRTTARIERLTGALPAAGTCRRVLRAEACRREAAARRRDPEPAGDDHGASEVEDA